MLELYTYAAMSDVTAAQLDAIQDAMAPGSALVGYKQGADIRHDGTGGNNIKVSGNRVLLGDTYADYGVVIAESSTAALFAANTWNYVYANANAAVETLSVSTTVPDTALVYKSGDAKYCFLGSYRSDAIGIMQHYKARSTYTYRRSFMGASRLLLATLRATLIAAPSGGTSLPQATINVADTTSFAASGTVLVVTGAGIQTVTYTGKTGTTFTGCTGGTGLMTNGNSVYPPWTTKSLAALVPPYAKIVHVLIDLQCSGTGVEPNAGVRTYGDTNDTARVTTQVFDAINGVNARRQMRLPIEVGYNATDPSLDINIVGAGAVADFYITGYEEAHSR